MRTAVVEITCNRCGRKARHGSDELGNWTGLHVAPAPAGTAPPDAPMGEGGEPWDFFSWDTPLDLCAGCIAPALDELAETIERFHS